MKNHPKINLQNIVWKEGKYYVSQCLNVDVSSFGKTRIEALSNLREALDLYFSETKSHKIQNILRPKIVTVPFKYA